ncbi:hypothetical protein EYR36_003520 [Pleurotus pulmonarius]|nr:hypothetical protein EYR36_003520 [Pleurotus pulmonarius]
MNLPFTFNTGHARSTLCITTNPYQPTVQYSLPALSQAQLFLPITHALHRTKLLDSINHAANSLVYSFPSPTLYIARNSSSNFAPTSQGSLPSHITPTSILKNAVSSIQNTRNGGTLTGNFGYHRLVPIQFETKRTDDQSIRPERLKTEPSGMDQDDGLAPSLPQARSGNTAVDDSTQWATPTPTSSTSNDEPEDQLGLCTNQSPDTMAARSSRLAELSTTHRIGIRDGNVRVFERRGGTLERAVSRRLRQGNIPRAGCLTREREQI